jgi:5-formyltetrahydrofolate cyclo-ligase
MKDKQEIRKHIKLLKDKMSFETKLINDKTIYDKVLNNEDFLKAKSIFIKYALAHNKIVYVPKVLSLKDGMIAVEIKAIDELKENKMGILEPELSKEKLDKAIEQNSNILKFDLILMPGVAFDNNGGRIGYGAGMYDKYLCGRYEEVKKIALTYDFQILSYVPTDRHDIKVDEIISNL